MPVLIYCQTARTCQLAVIEFFCARVCVEQYAQSIEDFSASLEILENHVDDVTTDRRIAETHYHMGVACVNAQRYDDAVAHFRDAIAILEAKILLLNAIIGDAASAVDGQDSVDEKVVEARKELKELDELIPEIKLKVRFYLDCSSDNK